MNRRTLVAATVMVVALAAAAPASASWLQQTTAAVTGAKTSQLEDVSCASAKVCVGVGSFTDSAGTHLLAEGRHGKTWTRHGIAAPTGAISSVLNGVSCAGASECTAVGSFVDASANTLSLAETLSGFTWSIDTTPNPTGATDTVLSAVSCITATACMAVGSFTDASATTKGLAERWNGSSWTILSVPTPAGATSAGLGGVSCTSATACIAVGSFIDAANHTLSLAEIWNGTHWKVQSTPNPTGSTFSPLHGVSCTTATACTAVGTGLAERWNGATWTLQTIVDPHRDTGHGAILSDVSCASATVCVGVGGFFQDAVLTLVAEAWNGTTWQVQTTPLDTSNDSSVLDGVSCADTHACVASGSYHDPVNGDHALAETFALRWQLQSIETPGGSIAASVDGVSCPSSTNCMAVGNFEASDSFQTFAETWTKTGWTIRSTPNPTTSNLSAVSCTSANACTAVGDFLGGGGDLLTLAERWNGTSWTIQSTPSPPHATRSFLTAVSCRSATACTAVGFWSKPHGSPRTLVESWDGTTWSIQNTPNPPGTSTVELNGVSCTAATACVAVGEATDMFSEVWNGSNWKIESTPTPSGGRGGFLKGVSCTAPTACTAVGNYFDGTNTVTLAERWNGTSWTTQAMPRAPRATISQLTSVSCVSATACTVAGTFRPGKNGLFATLAEHWNGTAWVVQSTESPPNAHQSVLSGVSCPIETMCTAVGWSDSNTGFEDVLAEQYS